MNMRATTPVWTWRDAIAQADIKPLTKLVLYTLANHMNDRGQVCWPSVETLMEQTGLSNRSVATHLALAVAAGFLEIERKHNDKGHRYRTWYTPCFPEQFELARKATHFPQPEDEKTLSEPASPRRRLSELCASLSEGGSRQNRPTGIDQQNYTGPASANDLSEKLIEAGGQGLANPANSPGLLVLSEPQRWLAAGCDLTLDILPTITARSSNARPGSIRSWSFFTQAVADAKATREAPMPAGYAVTARPPHRMSHEDRQAAMRARLREADEREEREAKAKLEAM